MFAQVLLRAALVYGPALAGAAVALVGLVVLLGWQLGAESITRIRPWLPSMLPLTAFGFLVAGFGLLALHRRHLPTTNTTGAGHRMVAPGSLGRYS